jgi:membrane protein YqaA with SNARE-associated domain
VLKHLLAAVGVVFGINLLPALGPPTWAVLVFFRYRYPGIPAPALIIGGAVAAVAGRYVLALAFRAFGRRLPRKRQESMQILGHAIAESRVGLLASFALFAVAPIPSAQLFEAAGLARIPLGRLLAAFFVGRLVSYSIYVSAASAAHESLSRLFTKGLFSPQAIVTELVGLALLVAVVVVDWPSVIDMVRGWWARRRGRPAPPPIRESLGSDRQSAG